MKALLLSLGFLVGCGSYQVGYKEEKTDSTKDKGAKGSGDPESGEKTKEGGVIDPATGSVATDEDPTKALRFSYTQLDGVSRITSSAKIINTLYFTGADTIGRRVLGRVKPGSAKAELIPYGRFSANDIVLTDQDYYLATNVDNAIYLMDDESIIEIDLTTLRATGEIFSECAMKKPQTFIKDSRWNLIFSSKAITCGMTDGATLDKDVVIDSYTGQPHNFDNYSTFSFDSENIWRYSHRAQQLVRYSPTFAQEEVFVTGAFLYGNDQSTFVSDSNGGMWFFGCNSSKACYVAAAEIEAQ